LLRELAKGHDRNAPHLCVRIAQCSVQCIGRTGTESADASQSGRRIRTYARTWCLQGIQ
jgi:hypothetical protein